MTAETGDLKLNGVTIDAALKELLNAYGAQEEKSDTSVSPDHPVIVRQRRISENTQGLEGTVKGILGKSIKADEGHADKIIKDLAYELAKTEAGFSLESEKFTDEMVRKYLTQAGSALGNLTIGNKTEFKKSIVNLAAAKPGDPLYDSNKELALLIQYIALQKDKETARLNYLNTLIGEKWTMPQYGIQLQKKIGNAFGIPLNQTATASDALGEINRKAQLEAQLYSAQTGKTYLTPKSQLDKAA